MRILLTGHKGQLGRTLLPFLSGAQVLGVDLPEYDITDRGAMLKLVRDFSPHLILHAAAMTNVDACARDPEAAYRVNGMGTQNLVLAAADVGAEFLYISTNEVFDGNAVHPHELDVAPTAEYLDCQVVYSKDDGVVDGRVFGPYHEWSLCNPINAYGRSKLAGEWYTRHLLTRFYIVRTAWLYAEGGANFPHKMIRLADKHGKLSVVTDEVGNPTYAKDLAKALAQLIETHAYGVYHLVNEGAASRFEFAREILHLGRRSRIPLEPITSAEFERASTPPPYAPLANHAAAALGIRLRPWPEALKDFLVATGYRR